MGDYCRRIRTVAGALMAFAAGTGQSSGSAGGGSGTATLLAAFGFAPKRPHAKHAVRFDGSSSHEAGGRIVSWKWSFGDGSRKTSGKRVSHRFKHKGKYWVTLTVTDAKGHKATVRKRITVST
jgi:PKD repeat protein